MLQFPATCLGRSMSLTFAGLLTKNFEELVTFATTSLHMSQENLVCAFVLSKLVQLVFKARKQEHIKPFRQKLHCYQPTQESSTKSQSCATILSLKLTHSICQFGWIVNSQETVYYPSKQLRSILDTKTFRISLTKTKTFGERTFPWHRPETVELIAIWCPSLTILTFF